MPPPPIAPARLPLLLIAALVPALAALAAGCGGDEKSSGATVVQELRGDTVVMVSSGEPERVRIDAVEVLWQSDEFEGSGLMMAQVGSHLVIGDRSRFHVVSIQDGGGHTFGRAGGGPGEFGFIWSAGGFGTDTIAVFDRGQSRISLFSLEGALLTSYRVTPPIPFVVPLGRIMQGSPLVRSGSGVLWEWRNPGNPRGEGMAEKALFWHDLEADTAATLQTWDENRMSPSPDGLSRGRDVFPFLVLTAVAPDGRVATGDPADYCLRLLHAIEEGGRMGCRDRSRVRVESGFHDRSGVDDPLDRDILEWENPVDLLPHFDRLLFSDSGDLWVSLYHDEFAHVHPIRRQPRYGAWKPTFREWEAFDRDAVLVRHVTLPGTFDLWVIVDDEGFGFLTLDTGEVVVGRVDLTGSTVPTS